MVLLSLSSITATLVANLALTTTVASNFDREITIEDTGGSIPKNEQFLYTKKKDSFENVHVIKDGLGVWTTEIMCSQVIQIILLLKKICK